MKRFIILICTLLVVAVFLGGSLFAVRKLHSMYKNIWDTLDATAESAHASAEMLANTSVQLSRMDERINRLHQHTFSYPDAPRSLDYSWVDQVPPYIAHACGGIDGLTYTNSREAFIHNYHLGQRVFEIDFNLSDDGFLIASHDENHWREISGSLEPYDLENFDNTKLHEKYESLNLTEVIELLAEYPDAYVVTDTKDVLQPYVSLAFSQLVYQAQKTHPEVLDRIIPQIYNEEMFAWLNAIYPFKSFIFTLYQTLWTPQSVLDFCKVSNVRFITLYHDRINEEILQLWDTLGIHVAVHTVNEPEKVQSYLDMGVDMIYTDFVTPDSSIQP